MCCNNSYKCCPCCRCGCNRSRPNYCSCGCNMNRCTDVNISAITQCPYLRAVHANLSCTKPCSSSQSSCTDRCDATRESTSVENAGGDNESK